MSKYWQPTAKPELLKARARLLTAIRRFMAERKILEVETPYLSHASSCDPNIEFFKTEFSSPASSGVNKLYLHTSPEYPMKRLLAAGAGNIYQIARVFRNQEVGSYHNPEFTLLEWYRIGFDHQQLMHEIDQLLLVLGFEPAEYKTYQEVFLQYTGMESHSCSDEELQAYSRRLGLVSESVDRVMCLDFIFQHSIAPHLGLERPCFIFDYPVCQSALARIRPQPIPVAERFELFIAGQELANGYHELTDAQEQRQRFNREQYRRRSLNLPQAEIDENLLESLHNLPACAGVAMGIDRLLMIMHGLSDIKEVLAFPIDRA